MHDYKKLKVWNEAMDLVTEIYHLTKKFPQEEKFGLTSQINRSSVSIPSNIGEGAGRNSNKDFSNFLSFANGSSFELETQLLIAKKLNYIKDEDLNQIMNKIDKVQKMIYNLKQKLDNK